MANSQISAQSNHVACVQIDAFHRNIEKQDETVRVAEKFFVIYKFFVWNICQIEIRLQVWLLLKNFREYRLSEFIFVVDTVPSVLNDLTIARRQFQLLTA